MSSNFDQLASLELALGMCASIDEVMEENAGQIERSFSQVMPNQNQITVNRGAPAFKPKTTEHAMIQNNDYSSIDSSDLESESNVDRGTAELRTNEEEKKEPDAPNF